MKSDLFKQIFLFLLSFWIIPAYAQKSLRQADSLLESALYAEAAALFLRELESTELPNELEAYQIRYKIALSYYLAENDADVIATLQNQNQQPIPNDSDLRKSHAQGLYLTALSYKRLLRQEEAISSFKAYLKCGDNKELNRFYEAQWELGIAYFELNQMPFARFHFEMVELSSASHANLAYSAQLYLAQIDIKEEKYQNAEKRLSTQPPDPLLSFEKAYVQGLLFFQQQECLQAAEFFEQAIPKRNSEKASWYPETLYYLGWSYLKVGDDPFKDAVAQASYFDKAEQVFLKLSNVTKEERVLLALGHYYVVRGHRLKEENTLHKAEALLSQTGLFKSKNAQNEALLLRTEAASSYTDKDKLYRQLTLEFRSNNPLFAQGWYLRGLNDLEEGQHLITTGQINEADQAFERAAFALEKAFELLRKTDPSQAAFALKYQAQALAYHSFQEFKLRSIEILNSFSMDHQDLLIAMADPDEIFYLQGLIASQLANNISNGDGFHTIAIGCLHQLIEKFPEGKYADDALNLLGTIHFQRGEYLEAKNNFLELSISYPHSVYVANSYFWLAKCSEKLNEGEAVIRKWRQQVFEKYPNCPYAAEAYFTYYPHGEYLQGSMEAFKHLQGMITLFPNSPFIMNAYYLIGLNYKHSRKNKENRIVHKRNLIAAIDAFQEIEATFDHLHGKGLIPSEDLEYFITIRYFGILEKALANLAIANESKGAKQQIYLEYAAEFFRGILKDFNDQDNLLTQLLLRSDPYMRIQEESAYGLAKTYIKANDETRAEETLTTLLEKYRAAKITRGYFLSRAWYEKGLIAQRQHNDALALDYFTRAEEIGKGGVLSVDEKLDLLIQKSLCLKALNKMDQAMLVLSQAINEDAISNLRLKAMYLRAEIYQEQGRNELARKQLEATAKKGGKWGLKAKEKLEKDYGYQ